MNHFGANLPVLETGFSGFCLLRTGFSASPFFKLLRMLFFTLSPISSMRDAATLSAGITSDTWKNTFVV